MKEHLVELDQRRPPRPHDAILTRFLVEAYAPASIEIADVEERARRGRLPDRLFVEEGVVGTALPA